MGAYSDAILAASGLRGYWRLGEASGTNANDETANNNDGTYQNTPTLGVSGALNGDSNTAASFNGTDESVSVVDATALDLADSFTLECWVKRGRIDTADNEILIHKGTLAYVLYITATSANRIVLQRSTIGDLANSGAFGIADTTTWHHIVAGKDGSTLRVYLDGINRTNVVLNSTCTDSASELRFANQSPISGLRYQGAMDEIAIYTGLLSAATVTEHYNIARATFMSINPVAEVDAPIVLTGRKSASLVAVQETDSAAALVGAKSLALGPVTEADTPLALIGRKSADLSPASEIDSPQALTGAKALYLTPASEVDLVQALVGRKTGALAPAAELNTAQTLVGLSLVEPPPSDLFAAGHIGIAKPGFARAGVKR